jgi:hypothetical protein
MRSRIDLGKVGLSVGATLAAICVAQTARAAEPPADLCSLLPAAEVSKTLGRGFDAPQKSAAPRPYRNTVEGTDCHYRSKDGSDLMFRAYADPSAVEATSLFDRLSSFYGPSTPIAGMADQAYFDANHAIHARKGRVRFFISLDAPGSFTPALEKQLRDIASRVAGQL